jgi:hypothetical protein
MFLLDLELVSIINILTRKLVSNTFELEKLCNLWKPHSFSKN